MGSKPILKMYSIISSNMHSNLLDFDIVREELFPINTRFRKEFTSFF